MKYLGIPQSGSLAGETASRNRYGQYLRTRAIPVNPDSTPQVTARARLVQLATTWDTLTDLQRAGWKSLGLSIQRTDSLGQTYDLTGLQAYVSINCNKLAVGDAVVADAPALSTPGTITSATITLTNAVFSIAYTATPLAAGVRLLAFLSPQRSSGRNFEADYRLIQVTAAAAASPMNVFAAYGARLGNPVVGNKIFGLLQTYQAGFHGFKFPFAQVVA